jgi:hypothetical protein
MAHEWTAPVGRTSDEMPSHPPYRCSTPCGSFVSLHSQNSSQGLAQWRAIAHPPRFHLGCSGFVFSGKVTTFGSALILQPGRPSRKCPKADAGKWLDQTRI